MGLFEREARCQAGAGRLRGRLVGCALASLATVLVLATSANGSDGGRYATVDDTHFMASFYYLLRPRSCAPAGKALLGWGDGQPRYDRFECDVRSLVTGRSCRVTLSFVDSQGYVDMAFTTPSGRLRPTESGWGWAAGSPRLLSVSAGAIRELYAVGDTRPWSACESRDIQHNPGGWCGTPLLSLPTATSAFREQGVPRPRQAPRVG